MNSDVLKAGTTTVSSITYGYDADNNITTKNITTKNITTKNITTKNITTKNITTKNITTKNTTGVAGAGSNTYSYDQLGRLTSWTKGSTTTPYEWDANSNMTAMEETAKVTARSVVAAQVMVATVVRVRAAASGAAARNRRPSAILNAS
ncbi:hypothetical protein [Kribbella sp. NPDC048915]|uniref:hypothetical protein n=1 Tax=Kribbella sp. NPDC048915 TaxID=3155148 RepID=UPI0033CDBA67